jgi:UDP-N-acetylmuramate dehydrogenase
VGGAAIYNSGAFGGTFVDNLAAVTAATPEGEEARFAVADLAYGYRSSRFQVDPSTSSGHGLAGWVILGAELRLRRGDVAELTAQLAGIRTRRRASQPKEPSAGSIFRNPDASNPMTAAGRLIEEAGLKGTRRGDAVISPRHGNFIVTLGKAEAADVAALIALAKEQVWKGFGVALETEVRFVGDWGNS